MSCESQTFTGISQSRFDCLTQAAQNNGVAIAGNAGEASKDGIIIRWQYDPAGQVLELQCTGSPAFIPCALINARIQAMVNACS
jgi:hypothetical protein